MSNKVFSQFLRLIETESTLVKTEKFTQSEDKSKEYTIFEASEENEVEVIQQLIESGVKIDSIDEQGNTALHRSVMKGNLEATQKLLELGIKIDAKNEDGETPLHIIANFDEESEGDIIFKISTILLEKGIDPNIQDELGNTALHYAALNGNLKLLKVLVANRGNVNLTNNFNWTLLHSAASAIVEGTENWEIIKWLIENGADTEVKSTMGSSVYNILEKDWTYAEHYKSIIEVPTIKK